MLELKNIYFFKDNKQILTDVSLNIDNQKFVAVTGPNGSGKSTLAKIIMGLFKPDSGQILFGITERAKLGIGFAFQQPVKFKGLTVKDLIEIAAGNSIKLAEACDYLSDVGLCAQEYLNREISASLSGGELKRIEIAMLAAKKSKLTIFDEPEAGIDLWSFNNLIKIFENMRETTKGTTIIISHQERILNIADKIILLNNGEVEKIVEFLKTNGGGPTYSEDVLAKIEKANSTDKELDEDPDDDTDPFLMEAIEAVIDMGQASASYIQRKFKVGYARAARIIDQMEERGIISGYEGSKPRKVLMPKERWEELKMAQPAVNNSNESN